ASRSVVTIVFALAVDESVAGEVVVGGYGPLGGHSLARGALLALRGGFLRLLQLPLPLEDGGLALSRHGRSPLEEGNPGGDPILTRPRRPYPGVEPAGRRSRPAKDPWDRAAAVRGSTRPRAGRAGRRRSAGARATGTPPRAGR